MILKHKRKPALTTTKTSSKQIQRKFDGAFYRQQIKANQILTSC